jgi:CRP-like cAMP-binding protein
MADYSFQETARTSLVTSLWYALRRHGMEIPYPTQTMEVRRPRISRRPQEEFEQEMVKELRQIDFLRDLSEQEIRLLVPNVQAHEFGAGETIFTEGETGDTMYIIRRGKVDAIGRTQNGSTRLVATLSRPQIIGEAGMMTGEPRNLSCKARTDVELLELNRESFAELFKQHPEAVEQIGEVIANRAAERKEVLKESGSDGATARRNWWIAKVREIFDV